MSSVEEPKLTKKDFKSDQDVRWCPGCGDYSILNSVQAAFADLGKKLHETVIISGIAEGMRSTWIPLITVVVAILVSFVAAGGGDTFLLGVLGVGIAAVGMLSTLGISLGVDAYGPVADNAGGLAEMAELPPEVRERTDALDAVGNTTAAIGKGFAIGSAALVSLALFGAFVTRARLEGKGINILQPMVFAWIGAGAQRMPSGETGGLSRG